MVSITGKAATSRTARAACCVVFSSPTALRLIRANQLAKGDVLAVARVAGIMAAKRTPELVPLCHPIALSHVSVDLRLPDDERQAVTDKRKRKGWENAIDIETTVSCNGPTGVEMEALSAAAAAALTVYDMCKAVDRAMVITDLRVVFKDGGRSGRWVEGAREADDGRGDAGGCRGGGGDVVAKE